VKRLILIGLVALAAAVAAVQAGATSSWSSSRSITLVSVHELSGSVVQVNVRITGWKMLPTRVGKKPNSATGGHWHIFVNGKYNNFSANAHTGKTLKLKHGTYKIHAELANNDHSELSPPVKSKAMTIKVD
jgi:cobalamin biosynthesis protein CbiD